MLELVKCPYCHLGLWLPLCQLSCPSTAPPPSHRVTGGAAPIHHTRGATPIPPGVAPGAAERGAPGFLASCVYHSHIKGIDIRS